MSILQLNFAICPQSSNLDFLIFGHEMVHPISMSARLFAQIRYRVVVKENPRMRMPEQSLCWRKAQAARVSQAISRLPPLTFWPEQSCLQVQPLVSRLGNRVALFCTESHRAFSQFWRSACVALVSLISQVSRSIPVFAALFSARKKKDIFPRSTGYFLEGEKKPISIFTFYGCSATASIINIAEDCW